MNSIYVVMEYFWNGDSWVDSEERGTPIRAFESKEEAENFITAMSVPVKKLQYEELENKENGGWKRVDDEVIRFVLWKIEGVIRAFTLRNEYGVDQSYAYYILEVPFEKEKEESEEMIKCCVTCKYHHLDGTKEPCTSCIRNCLSSDDSVSAWERKEKEDE